MILILLKWVLHNISHEIMITLLRVMYPILNLFLQIKLSFMVLTWTAINYHINIKSILRIWERIMPHTTNRRGGRIWTKEGENPQHLRLLPEKNLILTHYMLRGWWFQLLDGLGNYVIWPGNIEQVLMMANNLINFGYTYTKKSLKRTPYIVYTLIHISCLFTQTSSRLALALELRGRYWFLNRLILSTAFTGTNNQEGPTTFDTYTWFTL